MSYIKIAWLATTLFLSRLLTFLQVRLHIMRAWAHVYQWLFEREYRECPLPVVKSTSEIVKLVRGMKYRADGLPELGDAISSPRAIWGRHRDGQEAGDCDEFAHFIAAVVCESIATGIWPWSNPVVGAHILTVRWRDTHGRFGAHNVAMLTRAETKKISCLWVFGELGPAVPVYRNVTSYGFMDYGAPRWFGTIEAVVEAVRDVYAGPGSESAGWSLSEPFSLKPLRVSWK